MKENSIIPDLSNYIAACPTPYHTVAESICRLESAGFRAWAPSKAAKYGEKLYYSPTPTSLFAFSIGERTEKRGLKIRLGGAHIDSPCLHIKPNADMPSKEYLRLNVDVYGGPIINTWLDRPLSIAGCVAVKNKKGKAELELIDIKEPIISVPNLAIHMNRDVNKGVELNKQTDLLPLLGLSKDGEDKDGAFINFLASKIKRKPSDIIDCDLYIYNTESALVQGINGEFLSGPRLDDLTSCYALLEGIKAEPSVGCLNVAAFFNNEEIGSRSASGADSRLLPMLLENLYAALGLEIKELNSDILSGTLLSLDVAHAYHPNMNSKYDPTSYALMGDGVCFKLNSNQRYINDLKVLADLEVLCAEKKIPYKRFVNRSDLVGGGTIGNVLASWLPMPGLDMGVPILAMHSARETMGCADETALVNLLTAFFAA